MLFSLSPLTQYFPRNSRLVGAAGGRDGVQPNVDGFGDAESEVFEGEAHVDELRSGRCASCVRSTTGSLWQFDSLELAVGQHLNLESPHLRDEFVFFPLRDRLGSDLEGISERGNAPEVTDHIIQRFHRFSVNRLTTYVKSPYSRNHAGIGKLTYMLDKKKRERDPRAVERGVEIKRRRKDRRLSQLDVAKALGLTSRERISQIESGEAGELEHTYRMALCKLLGFEERELLLDPESAPEEFDMPLSPDAKSIAYRWDDLPESVRAHIKQVMSTAERTLRDSPELARQIYPEIAAPKKPKPRER